jgi:hypothetical protein
MSLINDALRRADMEQRQHDAGGETPTPPALPPEETDPPAPKHRSPWTVLLGLSLLILVGVVACGLWWGIDEIREKTGTAVETATAAFRQAVARGGKTAAPTSQVASTAPQTSIAKTGTPDAAAVGKAASETPAAGEAATEPATSSEPPTAEVPDGEPHPTTPAETVETTASLEPFARAEDTTLAVAGFLDDITPPDASVLDEAALDLRLSPEAAHLEAAGTDAGEQQVAGIFNRMLEMLQAASHTPGAGWQNAAAPGRPASADGTTAPATGSSTRDGAGTPAAPKPADEGEDQPGTAPPAPLPPVDTSALKISSIVSGPDGGLAIINGRPVREGESVAGARVIRISSRSVEVEINGRRATVGM